MRNDVVRREVSQRLRTDTRFDGWKAFEGFSDSRKEYPLRFGADIELRMVPRSDGWLYSPREGHLAVLEWEIQGFATVNVAKILCYVKTGGNFQELEVFKEEHPRRVSVVHLHREHNKKSRYDVGMARVLGDELEDAGSALRLRYYIHSKWHKDQDVSSTRSFASWIVECTASDVLGHT